MRNRMMLSMVLIVAACTAGYAADDPFMGTWKLDMGKSKFGCGSPEPKEATYKFEPFENGEKHTADSVKADNTAVHMEYMAKYDGNNYVVTGGDPVTTVALKRNNRTTEVTARDSYFKVVGNYKRVVSADGQTLTDAQKGTNAQGQSCTDVLVFAKQ